MAAIEGQLGARGLQREIVDLVEDNGETDTGDQRQRPAPLPAGLLPDSPDPQPRADSPEWIPRPRLCPLGAVTCSVCPRGERTCSNMIQAACSCGIHRDCALTFVEHIVSVGCSNGSGMVPCHDPAAHDATESVFLRRLFDQVIHDNAIGRDSLQDRIGSLNPLVQRRHGLADRVRASPLAHGGTPPTQHREGRSTTSDTTHSCHRPPNQSLAAGSTEGDPAGVPGQSRGRNTGDNGGPTPNPCWYCARTMDSWSEDAGELATRIPCGHGGMVHARCLWIRASHMAHGYRDRNPCLTCSAEPPFGRRPPHPAELVRQHDLPLEGGR